MDKIPGKLEVAPIYDKMRENHIRWFDQVYRRARNTIIRKIDSLEVTDIREKKKI